MSTLLKPPTSAADWGVFIPSQELPDPALLQLLSSRDSTAYHQQLLALDFERINVDIDTDVLIAGINHELERCIPKLSSNDPYHVYHEHYLYTIDTSRVRRSELKRRIVEYERRRDAISEHYKAVTRATLSSKPTTTPSEATEVLAAALGGATSSLVSAATTLEACIARLDGLALRVDRIAGTQAALAASLDAGSSSSNAGTHRGEPAEQDSTTGSWSTSTLA